ncbi:glycosyltransferase [Streptomyces sp. NPDC057620]|uniref:glycosyltransferase n=1 Tax=Streptomyces sp. NPDC057620 TaxID=3346185 RepID=UPI0036985285
MTAGSRGDAAPYTGLGRGLAEGGHEVTVVTHACFEGLVAAAGSADVLLLSSSLGPLGHAVAEGHGLPSMGVYLQPLSPTREFAPPVTGTRSLGAAGNRLAGRVFFGLGSATVPDAQRLGEEVVRALRAAGVRGVVQRGWAGLSVTGDDMFTVGEVPHAALFPRMAAVVHHAGAGTTGATLRAGVPAVPVPIQFDEAFWAARLVSLGVAPAAVPLRGLTADALGAAVARAVTDPAHTERARKLADRLGGEDGVRPVLTAVDRL